MQVKKIVFLASDTESSRWVYNALKDVLPISHAIIEQPVSKAQLLKRRMKKISPIKVMGQVLFSLLAVPYLSWKAKKRKVDLINKYQLDDSPFNSASSSHVTSVNDDDCRQNLQKLKPDIVLVNGTRIISKKTLQCVTATFINMHVGITPWYRGAHGGYWALYNNDAANFGTTIHLVDTGVDTGGVLKYIFAKPDKADNFTTYPIIQVAEGIRVLPEVINDFINSKHTVTTQEAKGKLYQQPAIWQYLKNRTR